MHELETLARALRPVCSDAVIDSGNSQIVLRSGPIGLGLRLINVARHGICAPLQFNLWVEKGKQAYRQWLQQKLQGWRFGDAGIVDFNPPREMSPEKGNAAIFLPGYSWRNMSADVLSGVVEAYTALDAKLREVQAYDFALAARDQPDCIDVKKKQIKGIVRMKEMDLSGEMCENVLLALKRDGADLIGDGVRKLTGKAYGELKLRKVAGIEILLRGITATPRLVVRLEVRESTEDRKQKFESIFTESKNGEQVYELTNVLIENGEVSERAVKEIHECYACAVSKMTADPETRLFYNRLDARRQQFERPKTCHDAIGELESSLLFAMSHGSHELFHTNVWAWLIKNERRFADVFFPGLSKHKIKEVRREQGNRDLTIWADESGVQRAYVVENKFKSTPREEQLSDYQSKLPKEAFAGGLLVTLCELPKGFRLGSWKHCLQADVIKAIGEKLEEIKNADDTVLVRNPFVVQLVEEYLRITKLMAELLPQYKRSLSDRWALALDRSEWEDPLDGDLESIRLADIFKKLNASDLAEHVRRCDQWKNLEKRVRVADKGRGVALEISTNFLHKQPVVNCGLMRTEANANGELVRTQIGTILQGSSFGRCACSEKANTSKFVYDELGDVEWFDDEAFLRPGLSLMKGKKEYKKYETEKYSFAYQDIAIESDQFGYLTNLMIGEMGKVVEKLESGKLDAYFDGRGTFA